MLEWELVLGIELTGHVRCVSLLCVVYLIGLIVAAVGCVMLDFCFVYCLLVLVLFNVCGLDVFCVDALRVVYVVDFSF